MDVEPTRLPRRREPIDLLEGIFLKTVTFLNTDLSKSVIVGIFKNRANSLGVLFTGRKGCVYWSHDVFNQFAVHFDAVTAALEGRKTVTYGIDSREDVKVHSVFGKTHVFLYDGEHTLTLNSVEWRHFVNNLPLVQRSLRELFWREDLIRQYLYDLAVYKQNGSGGGENECPKTELPAYLADRLFDEVAVQCYNKTRGSVVDNGSGS